MRTTVSESHGLSQRRVPRLWVVAHPEHFGAVHPVPHGATTIGRDVVDPWGPLSDLPGISRRHARVERMGSGVRIVDLDSHNGTWVNGARVRAASLDDGDVIRLGGLVLVLRVEPTTAEPGQARGELIGISAEHNRVVEALGQLAATRAPVLVTGESGVGKEVAVASVLADRWVVVDGPGLVPEVVPSDVFGQSEAAYPGAVPRQGAIARAEGGTLLLDGLDEAPRELHTTLLRWLGTGEYRPVGSDRPRTSSCRVVATAATLDPLPPALLARFASTIEIPPLRTRRQDIAAIARHVVGPLPSAVVERLLLRPWPGNGRQLVVWLHEQRARSDAPESWVLPEVVVPSPGPARPTTQELRQLLERCGGNVRKVAQTLGVARTTLYRWVEAAEIDLADFR